MIEKASKWKLKSFVIFSAIALIFLSYLAVILISVWPIESRTLSQAGVFGDSFGILTSLFSALAFGGLLVTIFIQQEELSLTRDELKETRLDIRLQSFENNFFKMQSIFNDIVQSFDLQNKSTLKVTASGRDCFSRFYTRMQRLYLLQTRNPSARSFDFYEVFWKQFQSDLSVYFRFLYNMYRYVDESDVADKFVYTNIIRSQLSDMELIVLFYNCKTERGKKFQLYADRYNIFDNLPDDLILDSAHR